MALFLLLEESKYQDYVKTPHLYEKPGLGI
jgi:hypothetical protein